MPTELDAFGDLIDLHTKVSDREHELTMSLFALIEDAIANDEQTISVGNLLALLKDVYAEVKQ